MIPRYNIVLLLLLLLLHYSFLDVNTSNVSKAYTHTHTHTPHLHTYTFYCFASFIHINLYNIQYIQMQFSFTSARCCVTSGNQSRCIGRSKAKIRYIHAHSVLSSTHIIHTPHHATRLSTSRTRHQCEY